MVTRGIAFTQASNTYVDVLLTFDGIQCTPCYTSISGQEICVIEFEYHPKTTGSFAFMVQTLKGDYIQMTKLVITKVF